MSGGLDQVVAAARAIAADQKHGFIGTEHLLAALLADRQGFSADLLSRAGLDVERVATGILQGLRAAAENEQGAEPATSRFAQRAIDAAAEQAQRDGRAEPEERDLLRQLIVQPKGRLAQLLRGDGKAPQALRAALGEPPEPAAPEPKPVPEPKPASERREARKAEKRPEREPRPERPPRADKREPREPREPRERRAPPDKRAPVEPARAAAVTDERAQDWEPRIARPDPRSRFPWSRLLLVAVPVSIAFKMLDFDPVLVFGIACLAVLPLAGLMGEATESLADRTGPTIGGLLNATFGNAAELIIALVALRAGLVDLVKASITGSILGNLLLILGLSFVAAGTRTSVVKFNRTNAGMSAAMLALAVISLVFPAVFHAIHGPPNATAELYLSEAVAVILIVTYGLSLLFSLKTHKALFGGGEHSTGTPKWGVGVSLGVLALATAGIVIESEILVGSVEAVTQTLGLTETFLGLVIIPLIGNAAEHATAVVVARKGQIDLALQIALGSSTQIALLVAPILVFAGLLFAAPMNLVFPIFDVAALAVSTIVIAIITLDGETHWFEGAQLLAVYGMIAAAAFFI